MRRTHGLSTSVICAPLSIAAQVAMFPSDMLTKTPPIQDPIDALLAASGPAVLAVIAGVEGPSYRPIGAIMAVFSETDRVGTLSSGCIESDISIHAMDVAASGKAQMLRYGRGSPFMDIQLPCGGGLDILLVPTPDADVIAEIARKRDARQPCALRFDLASGAMQIVPPAATQRTEHDLSVLFEPDIRFLVFGKGPEASTFAALVQSAGYPNLLLSPDTETLDNAGRSGCETRHLVTLDFPKGVAVDDRTAVVLFFHDHEWEPPLLAGALQTEAFYIGAQGSQRARDARHYALEAMDVDADALARLHGPVGLIPSARDAGTLAVSVLAEVLAKAMARIT